MNADVAEVVGYRDGRIRTCVEFELLRSLRGGQRCGAHEQHYRPTYRVWATSHELLSGALGHFVQHGFLLVGTHQVRAGFAVVRIVVH